MHESVQYSVSDLINVRL